MSCAPARFPWHRCLRVHKNTQTIIWNLIPLMMCRAATLQRAPQEEHYYASLCVSNKTQGGSTQVNIRSAHLCFTPPRPDYHLFSSVPLWSDTFGRGGAGGAKGGLRQMKFLLHIHRLSSKLGVHLILTEHFKQTEVDQMICDFEQTFTKVCCNSAAN